MTLNIATLKDDKNTVILENIKSYVKNVLQVSQVNLGANYNAEISHHYGLEEFSETGAVIINLINREYCKKLIILMSCQEHPKHYHIRKEETFRLLYGDLSVTLNNSTFSVELGESCLVKRGVVHSFSSLKGCIFEEISTHHHKGDSYYMDSRINNLKIDERKTYLTTMS